MRHSPYLPSEGTERYQQASKQCDEGRQRVTQGALGSPNVFGTSLLLGAYVLGTELEASALPNLYS